MQREPSSMLGTCVGHAGLQQHTQLISHCSQLLYCSRFWDVAFTCQNGELVHANRAFLAARSEFFRGLLFGGLQESHLAEIALPKVKAAPLRLVLHFLHTLEVRSTGGHQHQLIMAIVVSCTSILLRVHTAYTMLYPACIKSSDDQHRDQSLVSNRHRSFAITCRCN